MEEMDNLVEELKPEYLDKSIMASSASITQAKDPTQLQIEPSQENNDCPNCGSAGSAIFQEPIYAAGRIKARFSTPAIEKEFAQAVGRSESKDLTDQQIFFNALSLRENRYLARRLCWVLEIQGIETYILVPRDPSDIDLLVEAIRPEPSPMDMDIVIGKLGPIASPELCNGLMVPVVAFEQIYSFDWKTLIKSVPKPKNMKAEQFEASAEEVLRKIIENIDNAGATSEDRARNYLIMRYGGIYAKCAEYQALDFSLSAIDAKPSHLSGAREIVDVVLSFTNRSTDVVEKYFVRVDVTEEFPFLVSKIAQYFDR